MIRPCLALATAVALWVTPALAQDSFGAAQPGGPLQGALPQAQTGQGAPPRSALPEARTGQSVPPQGALSQQAPPGFPPPPAQSVIPGNQLDRLAALEQQDYGVPPTDRLHPGPMHGPTPATIPGGQLITTRGLVALIADGRTPHRLFDVLGGTQTIRGSLFAVPAHQPGRFDDAIQQQLGAYLQQVTGGDRALPLVFYCLSTQCWMSYNAALRAIRLGYTNVLWYRGGLEAWQTAGQPTQPIQAGYGQR